MAGAGLAGAGLVGGTGTAPLLWRVAGGVVMARVRAGVRRASAAGYAFPTAVSHVAHVGFVLVRFGAAAVLGAGLGEMVRRRLRRHERSGQIAADESTEEARLRADERRSLTRELHDVVTHQLSTVSLQVMSQRDGTELDQLRRALRRIGTATDAALSELRLLLRVLRDDSAAATGVDEVAELTQLVGPTAAAAEWTRRLESAGFDADVAVPDAADRLGMTVQRTLVRALEVTADHVLQHAAPRTSYAATIAVTPSQVVLRVASRLAPGAQTEASFGGGLRGLRERVDLTGGTFTAGPDADAWVVVVTLPIG